jgi:threonine aldolase
LSGLLVDLISDTVTQPSAEMRRAIAEAEVGDDVLGEDPTVRRLEREAAARAGKAAGLFFPSGTMANLCAVLAQAGRGADVLLSDESDLYNFQAGGMSVVGGCVMHPLRTGPDGRFDLGALEAEVRDRHDIECAPPALLCVETPNVRCGGVPLPLEYLRRLRAFCDRFGLRLHVDGARLFNAAIALGCDPADVARYGDSVQFCLSKGLGAPLGSVACGDEAFVERARRWRKMLGGGMRQAGIAAAAGLYALRHNVERLRLDHDRARRLAAGLARFEGVLVDPERVQTNMVVFRLAAGAAGVKAFLAALEREGVRMSEIAHGRVRAVTHMGVDDAGVDAAVEAVGRCLRAAPAAGAPVAGLPAAAAEPARPRPAAGGGLAG